MSRHTFRFRLQENELSSLIKQAGPLECTHQEVFFSGHTFMFRIQENELSSVITQAVPIECTHQELLFEWSHL